MRSVIVLLALLLAALPAAADIVRKERVHFSSGASSASLAGSIKGRDSVEYLLGAKSGQRMKVTLTSRSTSVYFNIFAPGKVPGTDEAMFIGDTGGNVYDGELPASGDYLIQVYLYRNAARAGESAKFSLEVAIEAQSGSGADALVPGTGFNATGELGCARDAGQPLGQCKFGVVRRAGGDADLTIFWPDGGSRVISFEKGTPVRYDESEADGGAALTFSKNVDLFTIMIGTQRFEFPEAAITGG